MGVRVERHLVQRRSAYSGFAEIGSPERDRFAWLDGCDDWGCGTNGSSYQGVLLNGVAQRIVGSGKSVVNAVILPTGEIVDLR